MADEIQTGRASGMVAAWPAGVVLGLLILLPAWVLILSGDVNGRGAYDQLNYHEPAIVRFAQQWPRVEVGNYLSATTPGYHVALATVAQVIGTDRMGLQLVGSLFSGALLGLLGCALARRVGVRRAIALGLPLVGSMYVFFPAVWLLPDNAGWLGVVAVLLLALSGRVDARFYLLTGATMLLLVLTRQIHVWAAGVAIAAAWLGPSNTESADAARWDLAGLFGGGVGESFKRAALVVVAMAPAVGALAWFMSVWGGLTPPQFHGAHQGANPAAGAFILAMFGLLGVFFVPLAWSGLARSLASNRAQVIGGAAIGLVAACAVPTSYSVEAGRYSGLWNLTRQIPVVGERSLLIVGLATVGGGLVMWFLGSLGRRERWVFGAAIAGYIAAMTASHEVWHRYVEPHVLIVLALMAASVVARDERLAVGGVPVGRRASRISLGLLALSALGIGLAGMTSLTIARAKPVRDLRLYTLPEFGVEGWSMPPGVLPAERAVDR